MEQVLSLPLPFCYFSETRFQTQLVFRFGAVEKSDDCGQAVIALVDVADVSPIDRMFSVAWCRQVKQQLADPLDQVLGDQVCVFVSGFCGQVRPFLISVVHACFPFRSCECVSHVHKDILMSWLCLPLSIVILIFFGQRMKKRQLVGNIHRQESLRIVQLPP